MKVMIELEDETVQVFQALAEVRGHDLEDFLTLVLTDSATSIVRHSNNANIDEDGQEHSEDDPREDR